MGLVTSCALVQDMRQVQSDGPQRRVDRLHLLRLLSNLLCRHSASYDRLRNMIVLYWPKTA
jgi:hypothetical protein